MFPTETIRVNLHCHSTFSDGEYAPELLAQKLAEAKVQFAALTDHDSVAGVARFHEALKRYHIGFLAGVEITSFHNGKELHLLGYGIDTADPELLSTLEHLRHNRRSRVQGPLRQMPSQRASAPNGKPAPGVVENGYLETKEAIGLIHRSGGRAFLAHPLVIDSDLDLLSSTIEELLAMGLDGFEGYSSCGAATQQEALRKQLEDHELLVCAGTDIHKMVADIDDSLYCDIPSEIWRQTVRSLSNDPIPADVEIESQHQETRRRKRRTPWIFLRPRIVLPSLLAILLFVIAIWGMVLPSLENILIDRKRNMIQEYTNITLSLLAEAHQDELLGKVSRTEAQQRVSKTINALRFGKDGKDYFWIQDLSPRMIMHPYRPELNGKDLSSFKDPRGTPIFVEFVETVRKHGGGFAAYVWQWQDDPERLAAKESYVVRFEPWDWVIGTGMYIDDVHREIWQIEKKLTYTLSGIVALILIVLLVNVRQSVLQENRRLDMQEDLRLAEQRYRSLVEATTEGTLLVLDNRCRYGNPTFLKMTGYSVNRLELLSLEDLLPQTTENAALWTCLRQLPEETEDSRRFSAVINAAHEISLECVVTINLIDLGGRKGVILLVRDNHGDDAAQQKLASQAFQEQLSTSLLFLQEVIDDMGTAPVFCRVETPIHKAAAIMNNQNTSCIVVESENGAPIGLVTDTDFRKRVAGKSATDLRDPVRTIMSAPLLTVSRQTVVYEALMLLEENKVQHLMVVDETGKVTRTVHISNLLQFHRYGPVALLQEIARAEDFEQVIRCCRMLPALAGSLIYAGANPRTVAYLNSQVCDAATCRFIELSIEELGPPPTQFTFIAMGSQGRQEQTLLTDQDNAIIYEDNNPAQANGPDALAPDQYFLALGEKVCRLLNEAGYALCLGEVMASNSKWCKPLAQWKKSFSEWIMKAEPQELLDISISLDFRPVYGESHLAHDLQQHIFTRLKDRPRFLPHLAKNALLFKPPARLLGKFIKPGSPAEEAGKLNLKEMLMPLVCYARLYALHHRLPYTHTLDRIEALEWKGVLQHSEIEAIQATYEFLMRRRFQAQLSCMEQGLVPDNNILIDSFSNMEDAMLKQAFVQIDSLQKKIAREFLEGVG